MENKTDFVIELEDDPLKNDELGPSWKFLRSAERPLITDTPALANHESESSFGKSYLSFEFTTIQSLDGKTLFVVRLHFHPAIDIQFTNAIVKWEFLPPDAATPNPPPAPRIVSHAPRKSYGGLTTEKKRVVWGLNLPLTIGLAPVTTGLTVNSGAEFEKEVEQSMTIIGTARGSPVRKQVTWTIQENPSSRNGLPSEVQLAVVVEHQGPVLCKVGVKGTVSRGFLFSRHVQSKAGPLGEGIVVRVDAYKGLLQEYEFKNDSEGWKRLLADWTGQVDDALLPFGTF